MAQVVPIKIKIGTEMYTEWAKQHKHEGRGIPIVYIVRADGETLYAKSGKPKKEAIGQMLSAALGDAGYIMTEKDVATIEKVKNEFREHRTNEKIDAAIRSLRKAKKYLDRNGNVASYAKSARELQEELDLLLTDTTKAIEGVSKKIGSAKNDQAQVEAVQEFEQVRAKFKPVKSLRSKFSEIQSEINSDKTLKAIQTGLRALKSAETANSESKKTRAIEKLETLISNSPSEEVKSRAKAILAKLQIN